MPLATVEEAIAEIRNGKMQAPDERWSSFGARWVSSIRVLASRCSSPIARQPVSLIPCSAIPQAHPRKLSIPVAAEVLHVNAVDLPAT